MRISMYADLSSLLPLKMGSICSSSCWCNLKGELPLMKLSRSTTLQGPKRYLPIHSIKVYSLQALSRCLGATIWFQNTQICSQVQTSSGTLNQGMLRRRGDLILTRVRSNILSYPSNTVLFLVGFMNDSLFPVMTFGVYVISPIYSGSGYRTYSDGCWFSSLFIERPLIITESRISQDSLTFQRWFSSWSTFMVSPLLLASTIAFLVSFMKPASQYSFMYSVLSSAMANSEALYILSKQSFILDCGILQQDMIRSGRYPNRASQRSLVPQSLKGNFIFESIRSWVS